SFDRLVVSGWTSALYREIQTPRSTIAFMQGAVSSDSVAIALEMPCLAPESLGFCCSALRFCFTTPSCCCTVALYSMIADGTSVNDGTISSSQELACSL